MSYTTPNLKWFRTACCGLAQLCEWRGLAEQLSRGASHVVAGRVAGLRSSEGWTSRCFPPAAGRRRQLLVAGTSAESLARVVGHLAYLQPRRAWLGLLRAPDGIARGSVSTSRGRAGPAVLLTTRLGGPGVPLLLHSVGWLSHWSEPRLKRNELAPHLPMWVVAEIPRSSALFELGWAQTRFQHFTGHTAL